MKVDRLPDLVKEISNEHKIMKAIRDIFFVKIDKEYADKIGKFELATSLTFEEMRQSDEMNKYKRNYGTVISVPQYYSDYVVKRIDGGVPKQRPYVSGEEIQKHIRLYGESNLVDKSMYYPSTHEKDEVITRKDIGSKIDIHAGETVFFMYTVVEKENFVAKTEDGGLIYKVNVEDIICVLREGKPVAQGGWVITEPDMQSWGDITSSLGIVTSSEKKAKYLKAFVVNCDNTDLGLKPHDHIVYAKHADFEVEINGTKYYVMKESDVFMMLDSVVRVRGYKNDNPAHFFYSSGLMTPYEGMLRARELEKGKTDSFYKVEVVEV